MLDMKDIGFGLLKYLLIFGFWFILLNIVTEPFWKWWRSVGRKR